MLSQNKQCQAALLVFQLTALHLMKDIVTVIGKIQ